MVVVEEFFVSYRDILKALQDEKISFEEAKYKLIKRKDKKSKQRLNHDRELNRSMKITPKIVNNYGLVLLGGHLFEELRLSEWKAANPNPNEVSIQVKASAISFTDTLCVQGLYPSHYPFVPGFEVSGVIRQVGEHITDLHVGDEVIAFTGSSMGGHAAYVTVPQDYVVRKPKDLSFEDACSFPLAFATVYHSFARGKLSHNDHILIQTATGGCGLMALQLARLKQCVCYGTSSREDKLALLKQWALPYVFNYKTCNIDEEIQRVSGHRGVDVVLNMLPGEHIQQGLNSLAKGGRYLELSMHGLLTNEPVSLSSLRFNQSVQTINLLGLLNKGDDGFIGSVLAQMVSWIESGDLVSTVSRIYPLDQIGEALRYVSEGEHIGKVVVSHTATEPMDCRQRCIDNVLKQGQMAALTATGGKSRVWGGTGVNDKPSPAVGIEERLLEGIAVIGLSGQYPKSKTLEQFWQTLADGVDCISEIPADRWSLEEYYSPIPEGGKTYCKWMGVLEDMDCFDPLFFAISPREAEVMDPQQRLFLENAWSCIEDAGINPKMLSRSRCGVFVGCGANDYSALMNSSHSTSLELMKELGNNSSILSARISYFLNLKGPCLAIDTACSSSLVAIAESCNSLVLGTSDLALAGGVLLMPGPSLHIGLSHGEMLSVDGRCFTFDQRANGFVPGEGVGVVLLKRMSDAVRDGDPIRAVIRGWGVNQDGRSNGITAPSSKAQSALEQEVYQRFNIDPSSITLVEAHGTGTKLGDPIEVEALAESFRVYTDKRHYCALGSVKSNIGHLGVGAGIAGVTKVLLSLQHRMLPPTIHCEDVNPQIALEGSPFYINTELKPWQSGDSIPRRAGVSSFGFSGTNAHLVLEEYLPHSTGTIESFAANHASTVIIPLSAKSHNSLYTYAQTLLIFLKRSQVTDAKKITIDHMECRLLDLAYTLQVGREAMDKRISFIVNTKQALVEKLNAFLEKEKTITDCYHYLFDSDKPSTEIFRLDEDDKVLINSWISQSQYHKLAEAWSQGLDIDWTLLYTHSSTPRRISLPTYPFARDRYWLPEKPRYNAANHPVSNHQTTTQNHSRFAIDTDHDVVAEIMQKTHQQELEQWLLKLLFVQLQHMGLFQHRVFETATALRQSAGIVDKYDRWWHECLSVLQDAGYLEWKDDSVAAAQALESESQEAWWSRWNTEYKHYQNDPEKKTLAILINDCLQALPGVLSGEQLITDIIFPNGSMEKMEGLYKNNRIADYCNQCVGDLLVQFIEARLSRDANARIRIIEIGAGTGGTTAIVLPMLQAYQDHIDTYCYTDVSKAFLMHGQEHYGEQYPYLSYCLCNIEQDLVAQGISVGDYDIAIAANVLHATRNIHETVSHVRQALAANGLLILNEFSQKSVFSSVIFGLIDGWALSEDTGLRIPGSPGLYPKQWQAVLEASGFGDVEFPLHDARELGQQIILATNAHANVASDLATSVIDHAPKRLPSAEVSMDERVSHDAMMKASVKQLLVEQLSQSLKLDMNEIHPDESFADYGVDSITGASFIQQLNDTLTLTLKTVCLFDHSSVNRLTAYLLSDYGDDIAQWLATAPALVDHPQSVVSQVLPERSPASTQAKPLPSVPPSLSMESPVQQESIAIIGMSGRFAASENLEAFWQQLAQGVDLVEPASRWGPQAETYYGSFLKDMDQFDPLFFNLSGVEASYMDPQQRCFLEESWNALENAGYVGDGIEGKRCGIYAGCVSGDYAQLLGDQPPPQAFWGNASSIIPARIAYYLNLQGPATAVDTACSSSLVAVHLACQALHLDEMEMALAGGVSLYPTPSLYESLRGADMLSSRGRCHSFDACADGIVIGEGVGVVVLKRLSAALADGDHIHGVIRGSGINQDGRSNGITAPSAQSQERLERWVYDRFDVNPEHIQMVEAHGTGTVLGDPIECEALTRAFRHYTDKEQYCAIGSVKTNMGHGTMVAGMAGLFKVVLSMQHRQIPPSLHFTQGNPNIDFDRSPFYVNTELRDWSVGEGETRCATVSAFGFSGTNAHAVIEEAPPVVRQHEEQPGYLVVLSAHSDDQLRQQVENLCGYCEHHPELDVGNLSYTLLLGRQHWSHRLAGVACDLEDLRRSLDQWLGQGKAPRVYVSALAEGEPRLQVSLQHVGNECIRACSESCSANHYVDALSTVGDLYVQGYPLEYGVLFAQGYGRIPLPTYPFARQRCWVPQTISHSTVDAISQHAFLHPLLHRNTSDFSCQRFSSTFNGSEFFLTDHLILGKKILPGAAYFEMVREAIKQACGFLDNSEVVIQLNDIVWTKVIAVDDDIKEVHIDLFVENGSESCLTHEFDRQNISLNYEVYTQNSEGNGRQNKKIIHNHGMVTLSSLNTTEVVDLDELRSHINQASLNAEQCYLAFESIGVQYGDRHRCIDTVYIGEHQVLAKLSMPEIAGDLDKCFVLHPGMVDSALQATLGITSDINDIMLADRQADYILTPKSTLPFALEKLEIIGKCTDSMWVWIRNSLSTDQKSPRSAVNDIQHLDIDLLDAQGKVCVRMRGFLSRVLPNNVNSLAEEPFTALNNSSTLLFHPVWRSQTLSSGNNLPNDARHLVLLYDLNMTNVEIEDVEFIDLHSKHLDLQDRYCDIALQVFEIVKDVMIDKSVQPVLIQLLVPNDGEQGVFTSLLALLKVARSENPKVITQLIQVQSPQTSQNLLRIITENSHDITHAEIRYHLDQRECLVWEAVPNLQKPYSTPWKSNSVYLITGGTGGIASQFVKAIAVSTTKSVLILVGRSPLNDEKKSYLLELESLGTIIKYYQTDVSQQDQVKALIKEIVQQYGQLNGVLHCAGIVNDNFILKKTSTEYKEVLLSKVSGTVNLDQATQSIELDFFILFSSISAVFGNAGQSDYSTANKFMDEFARYRNALVNRKERYGLTLSINWPYWREGGMSIEENFENIMQENTGMSALETSQGIEVLQRAWQLQYTQLLVMVGEMKRMESFLHKQGFEQIPVVSADTVSENKTSTIENLSADVDTLPFIEVQAYNMEQKTLDYLKNVFATTTQIPEKNIYVHETLDKYGVDSLLVMKMTNQLEKVFGKLSKTLFFEYQTIRELGDYFLKFHDEKLREFFQIDSKLSMLNNHGEIEVQKKGDEPSVGDRYKSADACLSRFISPVSAVNHQQKNVNNVPISSAVMDIAIIGLSGRYPQAENMEEYWENLCQGKDCITEIPKERWDWQDYYTDDPYQPGGHRSKWGGFIRDVDKFDPLFFNISPSEVELTDPQERLFLESAWAALEDAGYCRDYLQMLSSRTKSSFSSGDVGVYVGVMSSEYQLFAFEQNLRGHPISSVGSYASIANRVSYVLDLHGPSMTVDTMCSSSLTTLHLACQDLKLGRTDLGIVGGVNITIHPNKYQALSHAQIISTSGRCQSFGEQGQGYIPGEGVGAIILKRLVDAERDGDHIYGVVKGSAVNHGGKTNGYNVPNPNAQQQVVSRALREAAVNPHHVTYIEAHGTGTQLGDPIEITGLNKAFNSLTNELGLSAVAKQSCLIGSVKSNIGHCESAAGVAAISKVLLQMQHGQIVPSLHSKALNPNIDFTVTPFVVNQGLLDWKRLEVEGKRVPRIAGISSFGAGGSNAHVVIEEYVASNEKQEDFQGKVIIPLSAKTSDQLQEIVDRLLKFIEKNEQKGREIRLIDLAYTLQLGREVMEERLALIVESIPMLKENLARFKYSENDAQFFDTIKDIYRGRTRPGALDFAIFSEDEDMANTLDIWIQKGKYFKLAELWVKGVTIDWNKWYNALLTQNKYLKPRRISLPTYPFSRDRYWIPSAFPQQTFSTVIEADANQTLNELLCFEEKWQVQSELHDSVADQSHVINTLICFLTEKEHQKALQQSISFHSPKTRLIFISQAQAYEQYSSDHYAVNPEIGKTYQQAFQHIVKSIHKSDVTDIMYLWALEDERWITSPLPIVYLLKSIEVSLLKPEKLLFVGEFKTSLQRCYLESWLGFERSLGLVLPDIEVAVLLEAVEGTQSHTVTKQMDLWIEKLWSSLKAQKVHSSLYQNGRRYFLKTQPLQLVMNQSIQCLQGTLLITGGCGGLGFVFADYFSKTYKINLILVGRSDLDKEKQSQIQALEKSGSRVAYVQTDICDEKNLQLELDIAQKYCGPIQGVIHAAGIIDQKTIFEKSPENFQAVLAPKIQGTLILDNVLSAQSLDFICYFSSSSALLGDAGSCDYAMANRFLMAHAQYRNTLVSEGKRKGKTLVIHWPAWNVKGMGLNGLDENVKTEFYLKSSGQRLLDIKEGCELLNTLLAQDYSQCLILAGRKNRIYQFLGLTQDVSTSQVSQGQEVMNLQQDLDSNKRAEIEDLSVEECIILDLKTLITEQLKIPSAHLDVESNLADFGFDSVSLANFSRALSIHYHFNITPSVFFGYPTIERLSRYFLKEHTALMEAFYQQKKTSNSNNTLSVIVPHVKEKPTTDLISSNASPSIADPLPPQAIESIDEPIAIIGMSGRFPEARTVEAMWEILSEGKSAVQEIPIERFNWHEYYEHPSDDVRKTNSKWSACIPGIKEFDPQFFEISPREAKKLDPLQRHLLQESWNALENAAYGKLHIDNKTMGTFIGVEEGYYKNLLNEDEATLNHNAILASRLAYFLDFNGPTMAINTACSSGLVALHQACLSLRQQECDTAIVAAANLIFTPQVYVGMTQAGMLSPDGKCYTFDQRANGIVPGEAVVAIVLKRLSRAEADGDPIYASIRGTGINYDGKTNGITAPSGTAQTRLLKNVYKRAQVNVEDISYIVTHGTGTKLGDLIEVNALYDAFKSETRKQGYCALTSAKTNFGHTFAASGLLSLVNLVQAFQHDQIPASLYCEKENDYIQWSSSPFYVNKHNKPWPRQSGKPRLGAVSAFGMSGTNAHIVLQEYPDEVKNVSYKAPYFLLVLSAKTEIALQERLSSLLGALQYEPIKKQAMARIACTLQTGRYHFQYRCALVVKDRDEAISCLQQVSGSENPAHYLTGKVVRGLSKEKESDEYIQDLLQQTSLLKGNPKQYQEVLLTLANLYCKGYDIHWQSLYQTLPKRLHLPVYPFSRSHYWVNEDHQRHSSISQIKTETLREKKELLMLPDYIQRPDEVNTSVSLLDASQAWSAINTNAEHNSLSSVLNKNDPLNDLKSALSTRVDGMIPTLNRTGVMTENLNNYSQAFIDYVGKNKGEVLDLGCAYGIATIKALEQGAQVLAVDMEKQHLDILSDRVRDEIKNRLSTQVGILPDIGFEEERFSAIHASRVLHFLTPQEIQQILGKMYRWLKPGGKLYLVTDSPYMGYWSSKAQDYENRKDAGDLWPGYIEDVNACFDKETVAGAPSAINPLDPDILQRECKAAGFYVEKSEFFTGIEFARATDSESMGKEHVGVVAYKGPTVSSSEKEIEISLPEIKKDISLQKIRSLLRESLALELDLDADELDESISFTELGLDSINGVIWIRKINSHYELSITVSKVYDYPNIIELAEFLKQKIEQKNDIQNLSSSSYFSEDNQEVALSLKEILKKVEGNTLSIDKAEKLFEQFSLK
uniref:BryB n=2 Tax=Candidatus Endobugula sertula TaxID=62101 RepID=A2CLL1_9GAMM|nr:BryB [Candidatus Endobugula sertula]